MTLFKGDTTRLQHVRILDASTLTVKGLEVLKEHKIQDLEIHYLLDVSRLLDQCLSEWSLANLRSLNVRRSDHPINEYAYQFLALRKYLCFFDLGAPCQQHGISSTMKYLASDT